MISHKHTGLDSPKIDVDGAYKGDTALHTKTDETVAGVKTHTTIPILPATDATTDNQAVRKSQVDDAGDTAPTGTVEADDRLIDSADEVRTATSSTFTKKKEIEFNETDGVIRIEFKLQSLNGDEKARGTVYLNGAPTAFEAITITQDPDWDTFTDDLAVENGDLVQLYLSSDDDGLGDTAKCKDFRLSYLKGLDITPGTININ